MLLDIFSLPLCLSCQKESRDLVCFHCLSQIERVHNQPDGPFSYGRYEGTLKHLIHLFKYKNKFALANVLAKFLKEAAPIETDILIPVPLHRRKIQERKYNQSVLLIKALSPMIHVPFTLDVLKKKIFTHSQTELSKTKREQNIKGSFVVQNIKKIIGKHVLLVDDVYTTGATTQEAAKMLIASGAQKISILTIAS